MAWQSVLTAFIFVFVAALPGRTTFLMILMAARTSAVPVLLGSVLAFAVQTLIAVWLGQYLAYLPQVWVHIAAAILFLYYALHAWRESQMPADTSIPAPPGGKNWSAIRSAFALVFVAELADVSQIAIASLSATATDRHELFVAALAAMVLIAIGAVTLGANAHRLISPRSLQRLAAVTFLGLALYLLLSPLWSPA